MLIPVLLGSSAPSPSLLLLAPASLTDGPTTAAAAVTLPFIHAILPPKLAVFQVTLSGVATTGRDRPAVLVASYMAGPGSCTAFGTQQSHLLLWQPAMLASGLQLM